MTLSRQLQTLETSGLVQLAQDRPDLEYLFRHALVQDAAYGSLLLSDRKLMHSAVAHVLEQLFAEQLDEAAAVLAHHWQLAEQPQKALHYFMQAGDAAAKTYANDEAVEHYANSLILARQTATDSKTLVHLCTALGRVLELQSNYDQASVHYQAMSQLAEEHDDQALTLAALMRRTNLRITATPLQDLVLGESLAQEAMALAQALDDQPAQIRLLWSMISFYLYSGRPERAITTGKQALLLARQQDVAETEAYILNDLGLAYNLYGRFQDAFQMADQARALWRELNNLPMFIDSLAIGCIAAYYQGDYAQSIVFGDEGFQLGEAIGNPSAQAYVGSFMGFAYWKTGKTVAGIHMLETCIQLAETVQLMPMQLFGHACLALILNGLGAHDEALAKAQLAQTLAETHFRSMLAQVEAMQALVQIGRGDLAAAGVLIQRIKTDTYYTAGIGYNALSYLAEAIWLAKNGRYAQALTAIETHLATPRGQATTGLHPDYQLLKAQILIATGQPAAARAALQEAQALAEAHNNRQLLWQILAEEAALLTTLDELEAAQSLRQQARQLLIEMIDGMPDAYRGSFRELAAVTAVFHTNPHK